MSKVLLIRDETFQGDTLHELSVPVKKAQLTVREIISARVTAEVQQYNQRSGLVFQGLVQPLDAEKVLNGYRLKKRRFIDEEEQVYRALNAFQCNGFFVLVNELQVESLDQVVPLQQATIVSIIKLTPLVGG